MHIYSTNLHKQMLSVNIVQFNWFTPKAGAIESVRRRAGAARCDAARCVKAASRCQRQVSGAPTASAPPAHA